MAPTVGATTVSVTGSIRKILDDYPFSGGLFRELLQNSDDAKAREQVFALDCRSHASKKLRDPAFKSVQGPALLAYNDATFLEQDWVALTNISASSKIMDTSKIGKFGVGIRSTYHVTDHLQILSHDTLVTFDVLNTIVNTGVSQLSLTDTDKTAQTIDHFRPFMHFLGDGWTGGAFNGTIVRLPLRNSSSSGGLSDRVVTPTEIEGLMGAFIRDEFNISMLFLQHLRSIKFVKICEDGRVQELGKCEIGIEGVGDAEDILRKVVNVSVGGTTVREQWLVVNTVFADEEAARELTARTGKADEKELKEHKLRPFVGLAFPLDRDAGPEGSYDKGQLFTYLRLPLETGFPAHINAFFALTSSRQNLKGKDDRVLFEWNKVLFDVFIPRAWSRSLGILVQHQLSGVDIFKAWPSEQSYATCGESVYWYSFPKKLLSYVIQDKLAVWPLFQAPQPAYKSLKEVFIAPPDVHIKVLETFAKLGFAICRPPAYIVKILKESFGGDSQLFTPNSAAIELKNKYLEALKQCTSDELTTILGYLLSTTDLSNIIDIPIIRTIGNNLVAVRWQPYGPFYTLLEEAEAKLFEGCDNNAIALSHFSFNIASLLQSQGPSQFNLRLLDPDRVVHYLSQHPSRLGLNLSTIQTDPVAVPFLASFWAWFDGWRLRDSLWPKLQSSYLLPCLKGLKKADPSSPVFNGMGEACHPTLVALLDRLGVPFLFSTFDEVAKGVLRRKGLLKEVHDVKALLECLERSDESFEMTPSDAQLLLRHIVEHTTYVRSDIFTSVRKMLRKLPIFPVMASDEGTGATVESWVSLEEGVGVYAISSKAILPNVPNVKFLSPNSPVMIKPHMLMILGARSSTSLADVDVLDLAVRSNAFANQSPAILATILDHLNTRKYWLSPHVLDSLKKEKFVRSASGKLCAPQDLVDPGKHPLYALYSSDVERVPAVEDGVRKRIVEAVQELELFEKTLSVANVTDRIRWIDRNSGDPAFVDCAIQLLNILHEHNFNYGSLEYSPGYKWIPTRTNALFAKDECRPVSTNEDELALWDKVFQTLHPGVRVSSSMIRAFGWDQPIPTNSLTEQLRLTMEDPETCNYSQRIIALLKELGTRSLSGSPRDMIQSAVQGRKWVPTSRDDLLVEPSFAVFERAIPEAGIYEVAPSLRRARGASTLLRWLGCLDKPSFDTLIEVLTRLSKQPPSRESASAAVAVLTSIADNSSSRVSDEDLERLLIPDDDHHLRPKSEIVFNDIGAHAAFVRPDGLYLASNLISEQLSDRLTLQRLGLRVTDLQEHFEDMGASPVTLVQKTIGQYTEKQFLSEFLANAEDAKATEFSVILNAFNGTRRLNAEGDKWQLLSQEMKKFYTCPAVLVYNDSVFSDNDFQGICRTHVGGKEGDPNTIGQFGTGALTMFHFTELVVIISGSHVLFLDPSKKYLPIPGRAALKIPLKDMGKYYPDHLAPFTGLSMFPELHDLDNATHFPGTIFFLPLRTPDHCEGQGWISQKIWRTSAFGEILKDFRSRLNESLLFIHLSRVEMKTRNTHRQDASVTWSLTANRQEAQRDGYTILRVSLAYTDYLRRIPVTTTDWLIVSSLIPPSEVPPEHQTIRGTKFIRIGVAACLNDRERNRSFSFFSTLPLAIGTTLPVHVNASFLLSADRRQIRHDAYGTAETKFNEWILSDPLPKAYLVLLEEIAKERDNQRWWPANFYRAGTEEVEDEDALVANQDDALTAALVRAFYSVHVSTTTRQILSSMYEMQHASSFTNALLYPSGLSSAIKRLLRHLRPRNLVRLAIRSVHRQQAGFALLTPEAVKNLIRDNLQATSFIQDYDFSAFQEVLWYLSSSDPLNLCGLSLLRLRNGEWVQFEQRAGQPKYVWDQQTYFRDLFPGSYFVAPIALGDGLVKTLSEGGLNIAIFDASAVKTLVQERLATLPPTHRPHWIASFWGVYQHLPNLDLRSAIEDLPLVSTVSGEYVSLSQCKNETVLLAASLDEDPILHCIHDFGITIIARDRCPPLLVKILEMKDYSKPGTFLGRFLRALAPRISNVKTILARWPEDRKNDFSNWFFSQLLVKLPNEILSIARELPIWRAQRLSSTEWKPATEIYLLPPELDLRTGRFLDIFVCTSSKAKHLGVQVLSPQQLESYMEPPSLLLDSRDEPVYLALLTTSLSAQTSRTSIRVPNINRVMTNSSELYARQGLFEAAFGVHSDKFLLPSFSSLEHRLRTKKLIHQIDELNMNMFQKCAQALHNVRNDDGNIERRAHVLYRAYCEDLPLRIPSSQRGQWGQVDNLRFIPRDMSTTKAYGRWSLPLPTHILNMPRVESPAVLVREEYIAIVWTQRACFQTEPEQRVLIANPELGKPSIGEVVSHLQALKAMRQGDDVLHYLKETYKWLDNAGSELAQIVVQYNQEEIFLNIDDPIADQWTWASASQMAFENHDVQTIQRVRKFLLPFKTLLKAAGVIDVKYPEVDTNPTPEHTDGQILRLMRTGFADMRENGVFTDVVFTSEEDDDLKEADRLQFFAHRNFLSVFSGYFKDMFTGDFAEAQAASANSPRHIRLKHSKFAIRTVLDYLYTGDVISRSQEGIDFEDLLQVMELSHYLDIKSLFENVQLEVIRRRLIDPLTLEDVRGRAADVDAKRLVEYCDKYRNSNTEYIRRFQSPQLE